jgi:hypothetical protein
MDEQPAINASIEMDTESVKNVELSTADKERYLKSVLSDSVYTEDIALLDAQLMLKFKALTVQENTDVVNQIVLDRSNGAAADNDAYFITISTYRLALSLVSVDDKPFSTVTKEKFNSLSDKTTYVSARAKETLNWPTLKLSAYLDAFQLFEAKILKLAREVHTPNFWKASV